MNRIKKVMPLLALVIAITTAFAFKPMAKRTPLNCTWFVLATGTSEFNPANYSQAANQGDSFIINTLCPGSSIVCAICVPASEIYATGTTNAGKPKVDQTNPDSHIRDLIELGTEVTEDNATGEDWAVQRKSAV
jgi:hypothetical protein